VQKNIAAETHIAVGQFLIEDQTLNIEYIWYTKQEHEDQEFPKEDKTYNRDKFE
jgi:hypothetical protein